MMKILIAHLLIAGASNRGMRRAGIPQHVRRFSTGGWKRVECHLLGPRAGSNPFRPVESNLPHGHGQYYRREQWLDDD